MHTNPFFQCVITVKNANKVFYAFYNIVNPSVYFILGVIQHESVTFQVQKQPHLTRGYLIGQENLIGLEFV